MAEESGDHRRFKERSIRKLLRHTDRPEPKVTEDLFCEAFYTAKSSYGPTGLAAAIKVDSASKMETGDALHGLVLGVVELKIQFIENWLKFVLDIAPGIKQSEEYSELLTIIEEGSPYSRVTLHLPVQYWHLIPEFPTKFFPQFWKLKWAIYKGSVNLSKLSMNMDEADQIAVGSLVLLPESFNEQWSCSVSVPELSIELPGSYNAAASSWTASGGFEAVSTESVVSLDATKSNEAEGAQDIRGIVSHSIDVNTKTFLPNLNEQTLVSNKLTTHQECRLALSNGKIYSGYIAPVALGYGLFVTGTSSL